MAQRFVARHRLQGIDVWIRFVLFDQSGLAAPVSNISEVSRCG